MEEKEEWKDVGVYKGVDFTNCYEVSTFGNVRSLDRTITDKRGTRQPVKGQPIEPKLDRGYLRIALSKNGKRVYTTVHQLELQTFKPNPDPKIYTQVNQIDENPSNNHLNNLEWCTAEENINHGTRTERARQKNRLRFIPTMKLDLNGNIIDVYYQKEDITERNTGVTHHYIASSMNKGNNVINGYFWIKLDKYNELTQDELLNLINETKEKQRASNRCKKFVVLLDTQGNFIKQFDSLADTAKYVGCGVASVCDCLKGRIKSFCGYKCMYLNDYKGCNQ